MTNKRNWLMWATAALAWTTTAHAVTLSTPLGPVVGVGGGNTVNTCYLVNVSTVKAIASVTITEYQITFCEVGGTPCHTVVKNTVTCTNLQPTDVCRLRDDGTTLSQPVWCEFQVKGSPKYVRASMNVFDKVTGETLAIVQARVK